MIPKNRKGFLTPGLLLTEDSITNLSFGEAGEERLPEVALGEPVKYRAAFGFRMKTRHRVDDEVELGHLLVNLRELRVRDESSVQLRLELADRDTGMPTEAIATVSYDGSLADPAARAMSLRAALLFWFEHEVDELLFVNGVRFRDPHEPQKISISMKL